MAYLLAWGLTTLASAFVGSFLAGYLKKKGENLATHEDLNKLITQVEATTSATKAIDAKFSNEVWDRQRHWELKRDALFAAFGALRRADDTLKALATAYDNGRKANPQEWQQLKWDASQAWQKEINSYDEKRFVASLVCGNDIDAAMRNASKAIRGSATRVFKEQVYGYGEIATSVQSTIHDVFTLARKELGFSTQESAKS